MEDRVQTYVMQKYIRHSLSDRSVVISNDRKTGKQLRIFSRNGELKEKNIFTLFLTNPCEKIKVSHNGDEIDGIVIQRKTFNPIILTCKNQIITKLLYENIEDWTSVTCNFKEILEKWSMCLLNSIVRCVHTLQSKKAFIRQLEIGKQEQSNMIQKISLSRAIISVRYISYLLQNGVIGYIRLKRDFFSLWLNYWNNNTVKNIIRAKHKALTNKINFFNGIKPKQNIGIRYQNNVNDIYDKLNRINENVDKIFADLNFLIHSKNITDETRIDTVNCLQQIADLRHHIETINNKGEEFILIGDQSSGKSSLLCMLLGVNIAYTDSLFATRCPVRYLLEPCDPKMGWKFEFEDPRTKIFSVVSQEEIQKRLLNHFKGTIGRHIVFEPVTIRIWSPTCTSSMTLVDLPGLVGISESQEKKEQHKNSYAIVKEYMERPNTFILFVHRFDVDVGSLNTSILDAVKNKNKSNVIFCLTHFDRVCNDKDITYDNIYNNILQCSSEVANGSDMFLLSLSKDVNDLKKKEDLSNPTIKYLKDTFGDVLETRNIHFHVDSIKIFLRKKLHRHVLEIDSVLQEFLYKQKDILANEFNVFNKKYLAPKVTEEVLEQFNTLFKNKTQKLLKGHLIPDKHIIEQEFYEDLNSEVNNANIFSLRNSTDVWPSLIMLRKSIPYAIKKEIPDIETLNKQIEESEIETKEEQEPNDNSVELEVHEDSDNESIASSHVSTQHSSCLSKNDIVFSNGLDLSLTRQIMSHALFTRTVYELQKRLCCIEIRPSKEDVLHGITYDPNINLDTPKDSAHCVMIHTIKKQINMTGFFNYTIKRFEYITYKIIKYAIWSIINSNEKETRCATLLDNEEFQSMFEIEIHNYIEQLSSYTREKFISIFDEIINSPIVISHAERYKKMLINDFEWSEQLINECNNEDIFKPKNIGVHNNNHAKMEQDSNNRVEKICNLIRLHIHVRMLMMCELMTIHIDYNWRRMLDDTKDPEMCANPILYHNVYEHIKLNVCRNIHVNDKTYGVDSLLKIYNSNSTSKIEVDQKKVESIERLIENLHEHNEKIPEILQRSVNIAGDKFL